MKSLLNCLGMASSANKLVYGEQLFKKIQQRKIKLVLTTSDMGKSQLKKINDKCSFYDTEIINGLFDSDELNKSVGRKNVKAVGLEDINFIKLIKKNI